MNRHFGDITDKEFEVEVWLPKEKIRDVIFGALAINCDVEDDGLTGFRVSFAGPGGNKVSMWLNTEEFVQFRKVLEEAWQNQ